MNKSDEERSFSYKLGHMIGKIINTILFGLFIYLIISLFTFMVCAGFGIVWTWMRAIGVMGLLGIFFVASLIIG